jgi:hypothetical protein
MGSVVELKPRCCICGGRMRKYEGNNPYPVKESGLCCNACNGQVVVPARMSALLVELAGDRP